MSDRLRQTPVPKPPGEGRESRGREVDVSSKNIARILPFLKPGDVIDFATASGSTYKIRVKKMDVPANTPPGALPDTTLLMAEILDAPKGLAIPASGDALFIIPVHGDHPQVAFRDGKDMERKTTPVKSFDTRLSFQGWKEKVDREPIDYAVGRERLLAGIDAEIASLQGKMEAIQARVDEPAMDTMFAYTRAEVEALMSARTSSKRAEVDQGLLEEDARRLRELTVLRETVTGDAPSSPELTPRQRYELLHGAYSSLEPRIRNAAAQEADSVENPSSTPLPVIDKYRTLRDTYFTLQEAEQRMRAWVESTERTSSKNLADLWPNLKEGSVITATTGKGTVYGIKASRAYVEPGGGRMVLEGIVQSGNAQMTVGERVRFFVANQDHPSLLIQLIDRDGGGFQTSPAAEFRIETP